MLYGSEDKNKKISQELAVLSDDSKKYEGDCVKKEDVLYENCQKIIKLNTGNNLPVLFRSLKREKLLTSGLLEKLEKSNITKYFSEALLGELSKKTVDSNLINEIIDFNQNYKASTDNDNDVKKKCIEALRNKPKQAKKLANIFKKMKAAGILGISIINDLVTMPDDVLDKLDANDFTKKINIDSLGTGKRSSLVITYVSEGYEDLLSKTNTVSAMIDKINAAIAAKSSVSKGGERREPISTGRVKDVSGTDKGINAKNGEGVPGGGRKAAVNPLPKRRGSASDIGKDISKAPASAPKPVRRGSESDLSKKKAVSVDGKNGSVPGKLDKSRFGLDPHAKTGSREEGKGKDVRRKSLDPSRLNLNISRKTPEDVERKRRKSFSSMPTADPGLAGIELVVKSKHEGPPYRPSAGISLEDQLVKAIKKATTIDVEFVDADGLRRAEVAIPVNAVEKPASFSVEIKKADGKQSISFKANPETENFSPLISSALEYAKVSKQKQVSASPFADTPEKLIALVLQVEAENEVEKKKSGSHIINIVGYEIPEGNRLKGPDEEDFKRKLEAARPKPDVPYSPGPVVI